KPEETLRAGILPCRSHARKGNHHAQQRQPNDQSLAPNRPARDVEESQPLKIKIPFMNVWGSAGGAMQPGHIGSNRIEDSAGISEKGSKENDGHSHPCREGN